MPLTQSILEGAFHCPLRAFTFLNNDLCEEILIKTERQDAKSDSQHKEEQTGNPRARGHSKGQVWWLILPGTVMLATHMNS